MTAQHIEETQCDECGCWTNTEHLPEYGDDIELCYLCPNCYAKAKQISVKPLEM